MHDFSRLLRLVEDQIAELDIPCTPRLLYDPVRYGVADGGKRVRPVALLMGCELFGGKVREAMPAALAVELLHNFTLLHDDIMDRAPMRRGKPSVYKKWDENVAILSGDVMLVWAYRLLSRVDPSRVGEVLGLFNDMAAGVCEGQSRDMEFEGRERVTPEEYIEMIGQKTALLLAGSLRIGAVLGGASGADAEELYRYGYLVGLAFQIQDDLLDTYSDTVTLGKPVGGDILENKKNFLFTHACRLASEAQRDELDVLLRSRDMAPGDKIAAVRAVYDALDVKAVAEGAVTDYFAEAEAVLSGLGLPGERLAPLRGFTGMLVGRVK